MSTSNNIVPLQEAKRFIVDCLMKVGANEAPAKEMAEVLAAGDYRGHYSHGMNRLDFYVNDLRKKVVEPNAVPVILNETEATAMVDGKNALGATVGNFCMKLAIEKAKKAGVAWVVAKGSNHFGITGYYTMQATDAGLLGMAFTNTLPLLVPTRATERTLGTNPISIAAPGNDGDSFVLDMANTAVARGKIEMKKRKGEPIPEGWALDSQGQNTTDPSEALKSLKLLPTGGTELTSGYKGYGLSMAVEVLCGILGGGKYGPKLSTWGSNTEPMGYGQSYVALDPSCFAPGFGDRLSDLMDHIRSMTPMDPSKPVLVPGDPERIHMKKVDEDGGVGYHENQIKLWADLAKSLGVPPIKTK